MREMSMELDSEPPREGGYWFVRRGSGPAEGPYLWPTVEKEIQIGQLGGDDQVRKGRGDWRRVDELTASPSRFEPALSKSEADSGPPPDNPPSALEARRTRAAQRWSRLHPETSNGLRPMLVACVLIGFVVVIAVTSPLQSVPPDADCSAVAGPGINWDFCNRSGLNAESARLVGLTARNADFTGARLAGADLRQGDLAYADLSRADLSLAHLTGVRLVGASLRRARLNHADLGNADLRFTDFSGASIQGIELAGARLGNAIWVDGRICGRDSVSSCR